MGREDMRTGRETDVFRASHNQHAGKKTACARRRWSACWTHIIEMFESQGMGRAYYGYHNIYHDLGVAYVMLLSACSEKRPKGITDHDIKHLYVAALLHDFDPSKSVDKPHEEMVLGAISGDPKITAMLKDADISLPLVKALILSTTYPWEGENRPPGHEADRRVPCGLRRGTGRARPAGALFPAGKVPLGGGPRRRIRAGKLCPLHGVGKDERPRPGVEAVADSAAVGRVL